MSSEPSSRVDIGRNLLRSATLLAISFASSMVLVIRAIDSSEVPTWLAGLAMLSLFLALPAGIGLAMQAIVSAAYRLWQRRR